jgi:hypothetical protein
MSKYGAEKTFNLTIKEIDFSGFTLAASRTTAQIIHLGNMIGKPPTLITEDEVKYLELFGKEDFEFN